MARSEGRQRGSGTAALSESRNREQDRQAWGTSKIAPPNISSVGSSPFSVVARVTRTARRRASASTRTSRRSDPCRSSTPKRVGLNGPSKPAALSSSRSSAARMKPESSGRALFGGAARSQTMMSSDSTITSRPFTSCRSRTPSYRKSEQAPSSIRPFAKHAAWRQLSNPTCRVSISQSGSAARLQRIRAAYRPAVCPAVLESTIRSTGPDAVAIQAIRPFGPGVAARPSFRDPGKV